MYIPFTERERERGTHRENFFSLAVMKKKIPIAFLTTP